MRLATLIADCPSDAGQYCGYSCLDSQCALWCEGGALPTSCSKDEDCEDYQTCWNEVCSDNVYLESEPCESDEDCEDGKKCSEGRRMLKGKRRKLFGGMGEGHEGHGHGMNDETQGYCIDV